MKKLTLAASLLFAPAVILAQTSAQAQSQANVNANASTGGRQMSADAQAKVDANLRVAHERNLPQEPIRQRVAEGQAKGASDAQIVAASGRTLVDLQSSHDAMVRAGHSNPSSAETASGAQLLARGYTSAQVEAVAQQAPSNRSLVVAFETLTSLRARGTSTSTAVAQVESQLAARASDDQLRSLAVNGNATAGVTSALNVGRAAGTLGSASTTGSVMGAVSGVIGRKP